MKNTQDKEHVFLSHEESNELINDVRKSNLSKNQKTKVIASIFKGPIPPPEILEKYAKIYPDAPQKIIDNAVQESKFRRHIFLKKQNTNSGLAWGIMAFMFVFTILIFILSYLLLANGHNLGGSIFGLFGGISGLSFLVTCIKSVETLVGRRSPTDNKVKK